MMRHLAIGLAATVALLIGLKLSPNDSVWSSGVLASAHGKVSCEDCHDPFAGFTSADRCVACHPEQRLVPADKFSGGQCAGCHADHRGRDTDLTAAPLRSCHPCHSRSMVPLSALERPIGTHKARSFHTYHRVRDGGWIDSPPTTSSTSSTSPAESPASSPCSPCLRCHPMNLSAHAIKVDAGTVDDCGACHLGVHGADPAMGPKR